MGAAFYRAALLHDVDAVGVHDLGEAVGDDDHRAALLDGVERVLDLLGGNGVEGGGGLVEEDDGRVFEEKPGNGNALLLPARQLLSIGLILLGQGHNLVVEVSLLGGSLYLVQGCLEVAVADVFLDATLEDVVFLEHQPDALA